MAKVSKKYKISNQVSRKLIIPANLPANLGDIFTKRGKILAIFSIFLIILGFILLRFAISGENNNIQSYLSISFLFLGYLSFILSFFI